MTTAFMVAIDADSITLLYNSSIAAYCCLTGPIHSVLRFAKEVATEILIIAEGVDLAS